MKKLPEAEFQIMKVIWANEPPATSSMVRGYLSGEKSWPIQTVVTLLNRLTEKEFLRSEKTGRERQYYPLVLKEDYLRFETRNFLKQYHDNSLTGLLSKLCQEWTDKDLDDLQKWIWKRRDGE